MSASVKAMRAAIDGIPGRHVVVIGDLILDEYLFGKPARISREAPVLILSFSEREVLLGGAANAAHNVHDLAARVVPVGVVGKDSAGDELLGLDEEFNFADTAAPELDVVALDRNEAVAAIGVDLTFHLMDVGERRKIGNVKGHQGPLLRDSER